MPVLSRSSGLRVDSLECVSERSSGKVFIASDFGYQHWDDVDVEEEPQPLWLGPREWDDGTPPEQGPGFADASEAVRWWRSRGADWIVIRLDDSGYLWAGVGPPPPWSSPLPLFVDDDPGGRPEGAIATAKRWRKTLREGFKSTGVQRDAEEGARLRLRRESIGLSVEELAQRVNADTTWLADVESGRTTGDVSLRQWLDLVWATREPWPDERRFRHRGPIGWAGDRRLWTAEQIVRDILREDQK